MSQKHAPQTMSPHSWGVCRTTPKRGPFLSQKHAPQTMSPHSWGTYFRGRKVDPKSGVPFSWPSILSCRSHSVSLRGDRPSADLHRPHTHTPTRRRLNKFLLVLVRNFVWAEVSGSASLRFALAGNRELPCHMQVPSLRRAHGVVCSRGLTIRRTTPPTHPRSN